MKKILLTLSFAFAVLFAAKATDFTGIYVGTLNIDESEYPNSQILIYPGSADGKINFVLPNFIFGGELNVGTVSVLDIPVQNDGKILDVQDYPFYISAELNSTTIGYVNINMISDYVDPEEEIEFHSTFEGDDLVCLLQITGEGVDVTVLFSGTKATLTNYQALNPGFENWEAVSYKKTLSTIKGNEPTSWNSFLTGTGTLKSIACASETANQLVQTTDVRQGATGSYSAKISARIVAGFPANGNLTTGCVNMGSMTPDDASGNYNYTNKSNGENLPFMGHPSAMKVWVKTSISNASHHAKATAIIHSDGEYHDPTNNNTTYSNMEVAKAEQAFRSQNEWTQLTIPFEYYNNGKSRSGADAAYLLINLTTNETAGTGTADDAVWFDDIEFVYNSELASLSIDGNDVVFDANGHANINALWSNNTYSVVAVPADNFAKVCYGFDENNYTLTVKVYGDDYFVTPTNFHTYTVQFANPNYSRSVTADNYGTICLPAEVAAKDREGATFYNIAGVLKNSNGEYMSIVLEEEEGALAAGKPYIFKAEAAQINLTMKGALTSTVAEANGLVGKLNADEEDVPNDKYVISGDKFYLVDSSVSFKQYRAYIDADQIQEAAETAGRRVILGIDGVEEVTAIEDTEAAEIVKFIENGQILIKKNGRIYNIMGQIVR